MFEEQSKNPVSSVETTISVLERIKEREGATLQTLSADLDYAKSTIHRHLTTLCQEGYIVRENGEFDISFKLLDLASYRRENDPLFQFGRPVVDELAHRVDERVSIVTAEHGRVVKCYIAESNRSITTDSHLGLAMKMHCTADGKAILAHKSETYVQDVVETHGLDAKTDNTITDRDELADELARIRDERVAFDDQERLPGVRAVAAPVINDQSGDVLGSFGITGPATRLSGDKFHEELPKLVRRAADEIAVNMQYWRSE